jgi:hypothetical protein
MNLRNIARLAFLSAAVLTGTAVAQKVTVGIAPVFDGGGEEFGPVVTQHLTLFTYQDLLQTSFAQPVLLGPGGVYSPLDTSWLVEYVQDRPDLDFLLVATLKPVVNPSKEHWVIPVDVELLNAKTGDTVASWSVSTTISSQKTLLDYGQIILQQNSMQKYGEMKDKYIGTPSREFEKQPLGKATAQLSNSIRDTLKTKLPASPSAAAAVAAAASGTTCPVNVKITYKYKQSASHAYMLLANGLDQSTNLKDGVASFNAPEGDLLLQFAVNDAPYKLQKEPMYQLSVAHSCKFTNLFVDLGPGGDAHPHWE